jgi:hypothetical protein
MVILGMGIAEWDFFVCWHPWMEIEVWIFHHQDIRRRRSPLINADQNTFLFLLLSIPK